MKPIIFAILPFLAASLGLAYPSDPSEPLTKGLPPLGTLTKGLPSPLTKGLPPPPDTETKGLPPPPPETQTKGLPPPPSGNLTGGLPPNTILAQLPGIDSAVGVLSPECQNALFSIIISPEFLKCIPIASIVPIIPIITDPSIIAKFLADPAKGYSAIEKPFVQFSDLLCPAPKCSDAGVQQALKTLSTGCKAELKAKQPLISLIFGITTFYSPLHDSICFKNTKGKYCWDDSISTVISLPKSPIKIVDGGIIDSIAVADPGQICTLCNRALVNTFGNFLKNNTAALAVLNGVGITQKQLDLAHVGIAVKCGIKFEDGNVGNPGKGK